MTGLLDRLRRLVPRRRRPTCYVVAVDDDHRLAFVTGPGREPRVLLNDREFAFDPEAVLVERRDEAAAPVAVFNGRPHDVRHVTVRREDEVAADATTHSVPESLREGPLPVVERFGAVEDVL